MKPFAVITFALGSVEYRLRRFRDRWHVECRRTDRDRPPTRWEPWRRTFDTPAGAMAEVLLKYRGAARPLTGEARRIVKNHTATGRP